MGKCKWELKVDFTLTVFINFMKCHEVAVTRLPSCPLSLRCKDEQLEQLEDVNHWQSHDNQINNSVSTTSPQAEGQSGTKASTAAFPWVTQVSGH